MLIHTYILLCLSVGLRTAHGLRRLLRRTHAQHATRRRRLGLVHYLRHWTAVPPRVLDDAPHQQHWTPCYSACVGDSGPAQRVPSGSPVGRVSNRDVLGVVGGECGGGAGDEQMRI
jgi:hypothetical protein